MDIFLWILVANVLISFISFIGALTLFLKQELLNKILFGFVSFSAGALISGAFLHLIPEAIEMAGRQQLVNIFLYVILGFCVFFLLENFISLHHHISIGNERHQAFSYLILISDTIHNFLDGLVVAASFIAAVPIGIATSLAVVLHEIPQELGDFGILVYGGFNKAKALFLNFVSGASAILGGIIGFFLIARVEHLIIFLLAFAAGNFIYIASSDLVPEIRHKIDIGASIIHFFIFFLGIILMIILKFFVF